MSNGVVVTAKKVQREKGKGLAKSLETSPMFGRIVTWQVKRGSTRTHQDVIDALNKAGLDPGVARKIMPKFAFSRACKKLQDEAVFDVVKESADSVKFQLTKKSMANEEWTYSKDTILTLNKITGDISCKKSDIEQKAQKLLNEALEIRTTSDVTHMIQTLFEKNGDLFSIRDQGGVYFVPVEYEDFTMKVEKFLNELGGELSQFPIPKGTKEGDRSIQNAVADAFLNLISDHESAMELFTINTRADTMAAAAERIKITRVKIEAYASYLQGKSKDLLKAVDAAKKKLDNKILNLDVERDNAPEAAEEILGYSVTGVIKFMGMKDWGFNEAKAVLNKYGARVSDSTIRGQLWIGRSGRYDQFGKPADMDTKSAKKLEDERKKVSA